MAFKLVSFLKDIFTYSDDSLALATLDCPNCSARPRKFLKLTYKPSFIFHKFTRAWYEIMILAEKITKIA